MSFVKGEEPTVSITIPCRNEDKYIGRCLDSIVKCTYDKKLLKVFVCDGLSDDGTVDIIKSYQGKHGFIQYVPNKKQTTPFALNLGLKKPGFEVKIILGAHAEIHPDYIDKSVEILKSNPVVGCVGGVLENAYEDHRSQLIGKAMSSPFGVGNARFRTGSKDGFVDTVAFGAYRNRVFEKVGYIDEDLVRNQDDEFNYRLIKAGYKIFLSNEIKAKYYVRASYKKLFRQYYQYGYWKVYVNKKHKAITTLRQLIPALFVTFVAAGAFAAILFPRLFYVYGMGIFAYLLAACVFAFKLKPRIAEVPAIIKTFLILHFAYGIGYMEGIVQFLILGRNPRTSSTELTR